MTGLVQLEHMETMMMMRDELFILLFYLSFCFYFFVYFWCVLIWFVLDDVAE